MTDPQRIAIIEDFIEFAKNRLQIKKLPKINFADKRDWAVKRRSFGQYNPNIDTLEIYVGNRNLADILRTLGHELVHHRQNELGLLKPGSGDTGSDIENEANSLAGSMMRDYGRINDMIYESVIPSLKQIYEAEKSGSIQIYCDMDGVLCDFDSRFEHYYGVPPREYAKEKGQKAMEEAVDKVGPIYWSKMPWLKGGRELWAKISKYDPILLTSPGKFKYAKEGKLDWINENLSPKPKDIIFASTGNKYAAIKDKSPQEIKNSMLIDDYYPNLAPWKEVGGIAIMYKSFEATSNILDKFRLKEVNSTSIKEQVSKPQIEKDEEGGILTVTYNFNTDKNNYKVIFNSFEMPRVFEVEFGVDRGEFNALDTLQMTGEGNALKIFSTISDIINDFLQKFSGQYDEIVISGTNEKRSRIYKKFFPSKINPKYLDKVTIK